MIYNGKVVRVVDFGAFVNFLGAQDGLCHISELSNERVGKVTDVVKEGDMVKVKVLSVDDRGKVKLSMRGDRPGDRRGDRAGGAAAPARRAARRRAVTARSRPAPASARELTRRRGAACA